ncbi:MAG: sigma-70 family RNA polymerase sigma factor [Nakamurella sp.]
MIEEVVPLAGVLNDGMDDLARAVPGLYRVAFALTGARADSEDLVHSAVERYLATGPAPPDDLPAYLRRTMTNLHLNAAKRRSVHDRSLAKLSRARPPAAPDQDLQPDLFAALQQLPPLPRAVLVLRYLADLPVNDVAETLGRPAGTTRRLTHHALAQLRESPILQLIEGVPDDH